MRRLARFIQRLWILHDIWILEDTIAFEERRYNEWPQRQHLWGRELARRRGDLAMLDRYRKRAQPLLSGLRSVDNRSST